jgi:PAS domain S-box-containing protein
MAPSRILVLEEENMPPHELTERLRELGFRVAAYSEEEWGLPAETALHRIASQSQLAGGREWIVSALRLISDAVVAADGEGRILFLNPAAEILTGWPQSEAYGRSLAEVLRLEPTPAGEMAAAASAGSAAGLPIFQARLSGRGGGWIPVEAKAEPFSDAEGKTLGTVHILRDVSERERAESVYRRSEQRYRDLAEASRDILFTLSAEGLITSLNPAFEKATGRAVRDWLYRPFSDLVHPSDVESAQKAFQRALRGEWLPPLEMRLTTLAGGEVALECMCTPAGPQEHPGGVWGIARDITQRRNLEQRALQAQKMEAVGRLAGVIAHDFNNLLTTINGNADMLRQSLEPGGPSLGKVDNILGAVDRAAVLTRELLALGRNEAAAPQDTDLNAIVQRFAASLRGLHEENIELTVEADPSAPLVFADPGQLERILSILVSNAREAMPEGGRLGLSIAREPGPGQAEGIRLTVSDTGVGMGEQVKARLFEPFFTTKPVGRGAGLGLSTVYGIVKSIGGEIQVQSAPGQGASFILKFPASSASAAAAQTASPAPAENRPGAETILLVEDDDDVRFLLHSILKNQGYRVLEAKDGEQALQVAAAQDMPIHLVLTDLQMPKLGGRKLVEKLLASHSGMKVLFMSGFGREDFPEAGSMGLSVSFLEKPFMPKSLVRSIRKVLDG